jgi:hypothetical protein
LRISDCGFAIGLPICALRSGAVCQADGAAPIAVGESGVVPKDGNPRRGTHESRIQAGILMHDTAAQLAANPIDVTPDNHRACLLEELARANSELASSLRVP